jgi:amino acid adenylation domain-containing protein
MSNPFEQLLALPSEKRELLEDFLLESGSEYNVFPLSFAQQRLWFLDQFEPGSPLYNVPAAVRIRGMLDTTALAKSINAIVQRHEVLRTAFTTVDTLPVQVIAPSQVIEVPLIDLRKVSEAEREHQARRLTVKLAQQPFDLARGPLLRAELICLNDDEYVLSLIFHHIVADGWSMGVFVRELVAFYTACVAGTPVQLSDLPIQYADFALWQRQRLQDGVWGEQLAYWRQQLSDDLTVLQLPASRPRPPTQTFRGARYPVILSKSITEALQAFSQDEGVTLFMTLLAAFKTLLYRYTGQEQILVGSPIASRTRGEIEDLIGFFVNTLVLRTELSGELCFRELVHRVCQVALGAYAHQDIPFEKLVEDLQPERDMSHTPLFQVMFALQNTPLPTLELPGLSLTLVDVDNGMAKFDLTLDLAETADGLRGWFEYSTDLFDAATVSRMAEHLQTLLTGIVTDPDQKLGDLPLLTALERRQLLSEWNDTTADFLQDRCIHELFEIQMDERPEAIAVVWGENQITYRQLNRRANQLAHYLRKLGVGPEVRVGICLERSLDLTIGILGILKAGGAYLPLDPTHPQERLAFMLKDAQAPVLLTQQGLADRFAAEIARVIFLDRDWDTITKESEKNPINETLAENLAYVIYTSGSTGKPKGATVCHNNVTRLFKATAVWFNFDARDVWTFFHSCAFDFSVWEIWGSLLYGARLVVVPYLTSRSPAAFYNLLCEERVTVLNQTPSAFRQLARVKQETEKGVRELGLRLVIFGGEALELTSLRPWFDRHGDERPQMVNMYGITETTVHVTYCPLTVKDTGVTQGSMVGRSIPDLQTYLLDQRLNPVPVGVSGEIYVGGAGLARGYLNQSGLTADRFVPNPFDDKPGSRLYRTGDLARYLPGGNIEFLGRIDHQVKIRGFRIELGEIEAVLQTHPAVEETSVIAWGDPGEQRLVAYIVDHQQRISDDGQGPNDSRIADHAAPVISVGELQSFLKRQLPDYMVPSAFVTLPALPLTSNGKLDRRALPAPDTARPKLGSIFVAPRTPLEEILAALWAQVLGTKQVGVFDNFFDLGGHSLLATQLVTRIRATLRVDLPLRILFEDATVAKLADWVETALAVEQEAPAPPLHPTPRDGELPLSFAQERLWFLSQWEPDASVYNIPLAIRLSGSLDVRALEQSLDEIIRRHEALRTRFIVSDGKPAQVIAPELRLPLPLVDLSDLVEREAELQRQIDQQGLQPFDLARDSLIRTTLLRLGRDEHVLLLTMHHIISDGWSLGIFVDELAVLYKAFTTGRPSPLDELDIQYVDFATWQQKWLQGEVLEAQLAYWKQQLGGELAMLDLPTDRPRPPVQTFKGRSEMLVLPPSLTDALKAFSQREGVTLFMTLLAAFKTLLHRYTGQTDVVVGSPIAGRTRVETERLIGFFLNTLVLRTDLSESPTFRELLGRVRQVALQAYTHQDVPFEKLLEELQPERDLSRPPLFQVFFNMLNFPHAEIELPGLRVKPLSPPEIGAKFDLTLYVREQDQSIRFDLVYNADLYDRQRIVEMATQLEQLLSQVLENPDAKIADLTLVTDRAKTILPDPTQTLDATWYGAVHTRFSQQARQLGEKPAVIDNQQTWTYGELNARSNQLANYLRANGIRSQDVVAIYGQRDASIVWAVLGVLKAGATFFILDPAYPAQRLLDCLSLAQPKGLIQCEMAPELPGALERSLASLACICHLGPARHTGQAVTDLLTDYAVQEPDVTVGPDDLACIGFTSGSTGKPKGILGRHGPLSHFLPWQRQTFNLDASDRYSMLSGLAHDPLQRDIFTPLWLGATICIPDPNQLGVPGWLADWTQKNKITVAHLTPAMGQIMLEAAAVKIPTLRYAFFVGDALAKHDVVRLCRLAPAVTCVNFYGSTETQRAIGYFVVPDTRDTLADGYQAQMPLKETVPLGRGIQDVQLLVLNALQKLAGVGEMGEVYIRSPHLAAGYLQDTQLTQERFLVNPFTNQAQDRLYKTGDLGHYLPDGNVAFLGRADHQIKIRGFRIELEEIQAVLSEHPAIREAVVIAQARERKPADKRLLAFVVPDSSGAVPSNSELSSFLKQRLPDYMIPSVIVTLEALPLTPNLKVDRRALLKLDVDQVQSEETFVEPRNPIEEKLASIWADVLGVKKVGVHDNFFKLGGHSLTAIQLTSRVRQAFLVEIPLLDLFKEPTVANLAAVITKSQEQQKCERINVFKSEQVQAAETLENLVELLDEEVDALLDDLLSG